MIDKEVIKAILAKNSLTAFIAGIILVNIGSITDITIGQVSIKIPDLLGRIVLISIGIILITVGFGFSFLEYKTKINESETAKVTQNKINPITYMSTIRLIHFATNNALHSHPINYFHPESSGLQQITAFSKNSTDDFWIVMGADGSDKNYLSGKPVKDGEIIRLQHVNTTKNLHSERGRPSPVSRQQEVTGFGNDGVGDPDDNWRVDVENGGMWTEKKRVRLIHINTNHSLHSHFEGGSDFINKQQEVTAFKGRDENDFWFGNVINKPQ